MSIRKPRVLSASPALLAVLARCEVVASNLPLRRKRRRKPVVQLAHLARLEGEIGARLHDDVLVLLALGDPVASLLTGIESTMSIAEAAEDFEAPDGYVRIATVYSDPIGELVEEAHGGPYYDLVAPREPQGEVAEIFAGDDIAELSEPQTLASFIDGALDQAVSDGQLPSYADTKARPLDPPPRLVGSSARAPARTSERVRHAKFGLGSVISRTGTGPEARVVVAFDEAGERTMLGRFLAPAEDEAT